MNAEDVSWTDEPRREIIASEYPISASATKTYKRCPEQFRLHYIEGYESGDGGSDYLTMGTAVHETIEWYLEEHHSDWLGKAEIRDLLLGKFRERDDSYDDAEIHDDGLSCLEVAARYIAASDVEFLRGVEQDFEFGLTRPDIDHGFRGQIDVATESEIWDWKTGRNADSEDEVIQGMLYAMGYYATFGVVPDAVHFVYLRKEKERTLTPDDDGWQQMLRHVRRVVQSKESGQFEAKPSSSKCYWCGMEPYCSESPTGAGGIRWEVF